MAFQISPLSRTYAVENGERMRPACCRRRRAVGFVLTNLPTVWWRTAGGETFAARRRKPHARGVCSPLFTASFRLMPSSHDLTVQGLTNGIEVVGATNAVFELPIPALPKGTYLNRAEVRDPTPLVRSDPDNSLSSSITWWVKKTVAPPGPLESAKGRYIGLFSETDGHLVSSGLIKLTLSASGGFSGKLLLPRGTASFRGRFDAQGHALVNLTSPGRIPLTISLDIDAESKQIQGTVSNGDWISALRADLELSAADPARYTFLIPGREDGQSPAGDGYGSALVRPNGAVQLNGVVADGTRLRYSAKKPSWATFHFLLA